MSLRTEDKIRIKIDAGFILVVMYYLQDDGSINPDDYRVLGDVTPQYRAWVHIIKDLEITFGRSADMEDALKVHNLSANSTDGALFRSAISAMDAMIREASK